MFPGTARLLAAALLALPIASGPFSSTASAAEYDLEILSEQTPDVLEAGERIRVGVRLRNQGSLAWDPARSMALSYHWFDESGRELQRDGLRTALPRVVGPGEEIELEALLLPPQSEGSFRLQWDLVHEGVCWASQRDPTPPAARPRSVRRAGPLRAFSVVTEETPGLLVTGGTRSVALTLRNEGTGSWHVGRGLSLSYHWFDEAGETAVSEGLRTPIVVEVPPGAEVELEARLQGPAESGRHVLRWDMVEEGVCWFSERSPPPAEHRVLVLPDPLGAPGAFVVASLLALLALLVCRPRGGTVGAKLLSVADLAWFLSSLAAKQGAVLREARRTAEPGAGWSVVAGVALVGLLLLALPRRIRPLFTWGLVALGSGLLLADVVYLRFFGDVLSLAALGAAGQAGQVAASIGALLSPRDLWLLADLFPGALLVFAVRRVQPRAGRLPAGLAAALLVPLLVPGALTGWRMAHATSGQFVQVFQNLLVVEEIGALNFHAHDLATGLREWVFQRHLGAEDLSAIENWFRRRAPHRAGRGPTFGLARGRNLLMLQVESLQSFVVGLTIEGQEVTPNLNRLRREALWFSRCADQTAQGRTSDAELATQASLLPPVSGAAAFRFGSNRFTGLAQVLAGQGYSTLSAVPFRSDFWNRRLTHRGYGYQTSLFDRDFEPGFKIGWGLNDRDFLQQMAGRLALQPQPFTAYLITLSSHHPFDSFPATRRELRLGSLEETPLGNYLQAMRYFDSALGAFLAELAARGLLERTVVAIWGDHASGLPWDRSLAAVVGRPATEVEAKLRESIPLFVLTPGEPGPRGERALACGQVDFAPTLLALLGLDPAPWPWMGRNLLGMSGLGPVLLRHGNWVDDRRLRLHPGPTWKEGSCVDLASRESLPLGACRDLDRAAAEQLEMGKKVLLHDLQGVLRERLAAPR